jgi:hypothetical protein
MLIILIHVIQFISTFYKYIDSKIYNHLPLNIKLLSKDIKVLKYSLRSFLIEHIFTALTNTIILLSNEYFLFINHNTIQYWNTVLMNIINLLLNEHVMVSPINNVLITILEFYFCLIRTGLFYCGSQCSHDPCKSLMYTFTLCLTMADSISNLCMD